MDFSEYQKQAHTTAQYPDYNIHDVISYLGLGLAGEAGEITNKLKKALRGDYDIKELSHRKAIADEIGDVMWYCAELAGHLGFSFDEIAEANLQKLAWRKQNGAIKGSGDIR